MSDISNAMREAHDETFSTTPKGSVRTNQTKAADDRGDQKTGWRRHPEDGGAT
jgi:hypothetical protein